MTRWAAFAGLSLVVLSFLLVLSRLTQHRATRPQTSPSTDEAARIRTGRAGGPPQVRTEALLVNVSLSQGLFGTVLALGAIGTGVPATALGLSAEALSTSGLWVGAALGVALYGGNEVTTAVARRAGFDPDETLRGALAPTSPRGWAILLVVALPLIAGFEELLFRGALVGAIAVGFDVSPWLLAVLSSVAFALGHGAQGRLGMAITGLLGLGLAGAFVLTGSLVVVVVAHYVVNALEFVVHESSVPWF